MRMPTAFRVGTRCRALLTAALVFIGRGAEGQAPTTVEQEAATYRQTIATAERAKDSAALADAHNRLGLLHWSEVRYDSALVHLGRARSIRLAIGDSIGLGRTLNSLGSTHYQEGNYEPALESFARSLAVRTAIGDTRGAALVLTNIGKTYQDWGQFDRALPALEDAVETARLSGDAGSRGYSLHALGVLYMDLGDYDRARALFDSSLTTYTRSGGALSATDSASGWSLNALSLGRLAVLEGRPREALPHLNAVLEAANRGRSVRGQVNAYLELGRAHRALGDLVLAERMLTQSKDLARGVSQRLLALAALAELAELEEARGNSRVALGHLRAHNALRDSIFSQASAQRIAAMEARIEAERREIENARLRAQGETLAVEVERQRTIVLLSSALLVLAVALLGLLVKFNTRGREREQLLQKANADLGIANEELRKAVSEVRTLTGLIPICAHCKKVRDDRGFWEAVETFVADRSEAMFSHAICATCGPELYGTDWHGSAAEPAPAESRVLDSPDLGRTT
jgi:tetratricopeptide (TPR) repeat protein